MSTAEKIKALEASIAYSRKVIGQLSMSVNDTNWKEVGEQCADIEADMYNDMALLEQLKA